MKEHYKKLAVVCTIDEVDKIEAESRAAGFTKSSFIKQAVLRK